MAVKLSKRLQTIADAIPTGSRVVDVGTDHALLPISLVEQGQVTFAVATDVAPGPVRAAQENVQRHQASDRVSVRLGDGLETIRPGEVDTIVIAGMGGGTAVHILQAAPGVVQAAKRIVVQPMNASRQVRLYLKNLPFGLVDEHLLEEDGRVYEVLVADSGASDTEAYEDFCRDEGGRWLAAEFGPYILRKKGPVLHKHLDSVRGALQQTLRGLESGKTAAASLRKAEVEQQLSWLDQWWKEEMT